MKDLFNLLEAAFDFLTAFVSLLIVLIGYAAKDKDRKE